MEFTDHLDKQYIMSTTNHVTYFQYVLYNLFFFFGDFYRDRIFQFEICQLS